LIAETISHFPEYFNPCVAGSSPAGR
jgi:hypothetical protein